MTPKLLKRFKERTRKAGLSGLLHDVSQELRSQNVPAALRQAAESVADLIDGHGGSQGAVQGAVIVNVSVAVAVGAPGKDEAPQSPNREASDPGGVVIASAIATSPAPPKLAEARQNEAQSGDTPSEARAREPA